MVFFVEISRFVLNLDFVEQRKSKNCVLLKGAEPLTDIIEEVGSVKPNLPNYTTAEVAEHTTK